MSRNPTYDEDSELINNRQNGRRGRGRNGVRPQGGGGTGRPEQGNRIDNRARGTAAQLLEKYKALARDAQMASDRVMTEYYLQFADHYFRVLADTRARFDEQRRPQGEQQQGGANTFQDDYDADDGEADITDSFDDPRPDQQPRYQDRGNRNDNDRNGNDRNGQYNGQRGDAQSGQQDRHQRPQNDRQQYADRQQNDRAQAEGQQNGYQQDRGPRQDRNDRPGNDRQANDRQNNGQNTVQGHERQNGDRQDRPFRARDNQQDGNRADRPDRQPRQPRDDGQERGHEGQTYRTIRAEPDRGPVPSPIAVQPPREPVEAAQGDTPRRPRTRRPATEQQPLPITDAPLAEAPVIVAAAPAPVVEAPTVPVEEAPRRTRRARVATPVETGGDDQADMLTLPPAFLSTPADATPTEEKPRRRRRTRAEIDADNGDVAA